MTIKIPKSIKKEYKQGFDEYIRVMGKTVHVVLPSVKVDCPNCLWDSVSNTSSNVWDSNFLRPVTIFPQTPAQKTIFPQPFNVVSVSGVQYDPSLVDPKILSVRICPVCRGKGFLESPIEYCIKAVVTWNPEVRDGQVLNLPAGITGNSIVLVKTFSKNYALIKQAEYLVIEGTKVVFHNTPGIKGLGDNHITQFYGIASKTDMSVSDSYNGDIRVNNVTQGHISNQADLGTPTIPPTVPGDDVW